MFQMLMLMSLSSLAQSSLTLEPCNGDLNYSLVPETFTKPPEWLENQANPPISARRAAELADAFKSRYVTDDENWVWYRRDLSLVQWHADKWYWRVSYRASPADGGS